MAHPGAGVLLGEGINVEIDPPRRLVQTISGLKTWLETGDVLTTPGSLMYAG